MLMLINDYKLISRIGKGSYGEVWKAVNINKNKYVAIKLEKKNDKKTLKYETIVLRYLKELNCVPNIKYYGEVQKYNYLIMDLLDIQIDCYYNNKKFLVNDKNRLISNLGIEMLNCIENIHLNGIIHRDIKPDNFMMNSKNKLILIDFGLSRQYINKQGIHKINKKHNNITGSLRYCSIFIHNYNEPSRRDDLISMVYILLFLINDTLPWQGIKVNSRNEKEAIIYSKKKYFSQILKNNSSSIFKKIGDLLEYLENLSYLEQPNYEFIKFLIKSLY